MKDTFPCDVVGCEGDMKLMRHVSFVDCPGHDILMATMLNGAAVMDGEAISNTYVLFRGREDYLCWNRLEILCA